MGQIRQVVVNGLPDYFQVYLEIAMRQCIAHFVGKSPRHLGVLLCKIGMM